MNLDQWLDEYSQDHQNYVNQRIHMICVPLIFLSLVGGLVLIPWKIGSIPVTSFGTIALIAWYSRLGSLAMVIMGAQILAAMFITFGLVHFIGVLNTAIVYGVVFVLAWIGQFVGHKKEGRSPSFFKDLQYLLIGPLWVWLGH